MHRLTPLPLAVVLCLSAVAVADDPQITLTVTAASTRDSNDGFRAVYGGVMLTIFLGKDMPHVWKGDTVEFRGRLFSIRPYPDVWEMAVIAENLRVLTSLQKRAAQAKSNQSKPSLLRLYGVRP